MMLFAAMFNLLILVIFRAAPALFYNYIYYHIIEIGCDSWGSGPPLHPVSHALNKHIK